ncbi:MAG: HlyD family efflux transporter periplasmic adaptor subunit [Magnetococcales bacterium]|nr:HlyD family efflux transporter periplasmic adaptor subunit [Magnetococcales bacterium]
MAGLATLVTLEREARHAGSLELLGFIIVNESLRLFPYTQSLFWHRPRRGHFPLQTISGVDRFDPDAPQVVWMGRAVRAIAAGEEASPPVSPPDSAAGSPEGTVARVVGEGDLPPALGREWREWCPPWGLWSPLRDPLSGELLGGVWYFRDTPWEEGERLLAGHLGDAYAQSLALLRRRRHSPIGRFHLSAVVGWMLFLGLVAVAGVQRVPLSALAPATIVARDPTLVTAPVDGVVAHFPVRPNQSVEAGELLFALDPTTVAHRLEVARGELSLAEAEYFRLRQQAFLDREDGARLKALEAERQKAATEVAYATELLDRLEVRAPRAGVAIFSDANDWLGRPVRVGERILAIADPGAVEVEIELATVDAITLEPGAAVRLFLHTDPLRPLAATLRQADHEAGNAADGTLAFRLKATLEGGGRPPRLGLQGTAKLYGEEVSLAYYLLRRPMAAWNRWSGW